ncbi:hypothetical protein [Micromonospora inositola]|uniref:Uncharacterized protein n=1 Tax=Micromonospora inositola TaxID=47865 RepID=A0A1C5IQK9_9ACTN|nr:hypothetical protein [Micromonospora inositola]SCG60289.1 hypothetical protein GA0070613_3223 [Micromonospora inositola]
MTQTVTGYLAASNRHLSTGTPLSLVVPCEPCNGLHWHGAGTVEQPDHSPGDVTERISHCHRGNEYERIRIAAEPFRPEWVTALRGRQSSAYRRHLELAR